MPDTAEGLLVFIKNFGYLRLAENSYATSADDVWVSPDLIQRFGLRAADRVMGRVVPPNADRKHWSLADVMQINKKDPSKSRNRPFFEKLTPTYPDKQLRLEHARENLSSRIVDLTCPIGKGQRCLIVAPPRTGKTVLMQDIAKAISHNYPEIILIVLLIDERPEEVTDMKEVVDGEVIASTFDEQPERHVEVAEVVVERAKRLAEMGGDVVILLDSITRLARAYNTVAPVSGRVLSGGIDAKALTPPKKIFGAARNLKEGGSITIIGSALVDTGSKMDDVIFEEFKGTGNAEIHLDRQLMERRIFPCIDILKSGTRKEELLLDKVVKDKMWAVRHLFSEKRVTAVQAMEILHGHVKGHKTNAELILSLH